MAISKLRRRLPSNPYSPYGEIASPVSPVLERKEGAGEKTVMPNADVAGVERIVALPEAVLAADPEGKAREEEVEEVEEGSGELVDALGPMEKGEEAANSLLMSPTSVARRV
ncbi:hypothetical protein EYR40_002544 [Pleurotus pulmonarius]|nr:hypothetical protein EYR40_002544 [Pleurotus pulmonarius]